MSGRRPAAWLERRIARRLADDPHRDSTLGDLAEGYVDLRRRRGRVAAELWYLRQAASLLLRGTAPRGRRGNPGDQLLPAVRAVRRRPAFAAMVTAVLGVAIGATLAAFSVTAGTWEAARWWADEDATVLVWPEYRFSRGQLDVLRQESRAFEAVGGYLRSPVVLTLPDRTASAGGVAISPELFAALRAKPQLGRGLEPDDAVRGAEPVAVLGHGLWQRAFGGAPGVVGQVVELSGTRVRVVGIMPAGAAQPGPGTEVWTPLRLDPRGDDFWPAYELSVAAILRPGLGLVEARDDVRRVLGDLARRFAFFFRPDFGSDATVMGSAQAAWGAVATPLVLLLGGTALLLLVAAIDVGNLVLARSIERRVEMRVRLALGASRPRLTGQILAESGILALLAGGLGWMLGAVLAARLPGLFPFGTPVVASGATEPRLILVVLTLTLVAWAMMAAIPALHLVTSTRRVIAPRAAGTGTARGLVIAQAALATVLMVSAVLLLRTVRSIERIPLGFEPADTWAWAVAAPPGTAAALQDGLVAEVTALPGVSAAGWISAIPLLDPVLTAPVNREEAQVDVARAPHAARFVIDPGAHAALELRVLRGRGFLPGDDAGAAPVALINRAMARALWPDTDPLGRRIAIDPHGWNRWITVVGVVEDIRFRDLTAPGGPAFFLPRAQAPTAAMRFVARTSVPPAALTPILRGALGRLDGTASAGEARALRSVVRDAQGPARVMTSLLTALGLLATFLGALGLHGALAGWVARRSLEIGTRIALGASPSRLSAGILGTGVALTGTGILLGCIGAAVVGRALRSLLFGVSPLDPVAFGIPVALLLATGLIAAAIPALRAAAVPPARALREG